MWFRNDIGVCVWLSSAKLSIDGSYCSSYNGSKVKMNPGWNIILAASNIHIFDIVDLYLLDFVAQGGFLACRPEGQDWLNKISSLPSIASIIQGLVLKRKFETHFSWPRPIWKVSVKVGPILMAGLLWPKAMEWCLHIIFLILSMFSKKNQSWKYADFCCGLGLISMSWTTSISNKFHVHIWWL